MTHHLATTVLGEGRPFVWGHGLTSSRASEDVAKLFDWSGIAERGHQVVRYDARGHGTTGGPPDPAAYQWPQLATDLLALVDEMGADQVDAGGASMGCASTLHAAVRAPERFGRLVLVIPPTAWETRAAQADLYEASAALVEREGKDAWLVAAAQAPRPAVFDELPPFPPSADIPEALMPSVLRGAAASDLPDPSALEQLAHPALVVAWAGDPGHPESTARRLAELLPNAELHVALDLAGVLRWRGLIADFLAQQ